MSEQEAVVENGSLYQSDKEFNRNKWLFCVGGIGRDALYCLVSTYFLQYVQFGLTLTVAQFTTLSLLIGILGRIWDGINDPMMGAIIDGSHLKWGKFKPWIFWGAIADAILTVVLFNLRPFGTGVAQGWLYVSLICAVYLIWEAAFTMNDIGYWSMIPSLARTKDRRDKMTTLTIFFAGLGTIIMTGLVTFFSPGNLLNAYTIFSIIACVMVIGCQTMTAFGVKEAPREESENKPENKISLKRMIKTIFNNKQLLWMALALLCSSSAQGILMGLIYNLYYLEIGYDGNIFIFVVIYALANTVVQLTYPALARKLGRKKVQLIGFSIEALGYILMGLAGWTSWLPLNLITVCAFGVPIFVGNTWFYTATLVNMSNCVEYNEYTTGQRNESVVSTVRPLIVKFGDAIKYLVVTLTLTLSGIYFITNKVSTVENQKSQFEKKVASDTLFANDKNQYEENIEHYINSVITLSAEAEAAKAQYGEDSSEYKAKLAEIDEEIAQDDLLRNCQLQAEYIDAVTGMYLVGYDANGEYLDTKQVSDLSVLSSLVYIANGNKYSLVITPTELNKATNANNNTVNDIYGTMKTASARVQLRLASCLLPVLLMFGSFIIQRTKFIIDEEYFDMMMKEIEAKKQGSLEEAKAEEEPEANEA
ncbi:MAG: glycoside-pentoside-hexuronide (GPH):cation symporter [Gammaproteobacteria bacterium]|nr:glycoside-pentoside-hexuronide (GPH):cation symporter [Gammaproteobacteria bacterium]